MKCVSCGFTSEGKFIECPSCHFYSLEAIPNHRLFKLKRTILGLYRSGFGVSTKHSLATGNCDVCHKRGGSSLINGKLVHSKPKCIRRAAERVPFWLPILSLALSCLLVWGLKLPEFRWMLFASGLSLKVEDVPMRRRLLKSAAAGLGVAAVGAVLAGKVPVAEASQGLVAPSAGVSLSQQNAFPANAGGWLQVDAEYTVFVSGGYYYARNGSTGSIDYGGAKSNGSVSGSDAAAVISAAIAALANGGRVFIKAGTYTLASLNVLIGGEAGSAAVGSTSVSNVDLCGEGEATYLKAATNLNGTLIAAMNVNGWYVHDLQVDGNRANQSGAGTYPELMGIDILSSTNCINEKCYVHDCKTYGIAVSSGTRCSVLDNFVLNCNANGIILYGGQSIVARGNQINGASDVGLDVSGISSSSPITDVVCEQNIVVNVNLGTSPWSLNTGLGIDVGDNGYVVRAIIKGNIVDTCSGWGLQSGPSGTNNDITFEGNQVYGCAGGVYANSTNGLKVVWNTVDTTTNNTNNEGCGIFIYTGVPDANIKGNTINNPGYTPILIQSAGCYVLGNTIIFGAGAGTEIYACQLNGTNCNFSNNTIDASGAAGGLAGCWGIAVGADNAVIMGNSLIGNASNANWFPVVTYNKNGVYIGNSAVNFSAGGGFLDYGIGNLIFGNSGWNPWGLISNPFNNTNDTAGTNGGSASPNASTDYVAQGPNLVINSTGGTGVSITIKDNKGNAVLSGLSSLAGQRIPYGWKINFGAFSVAPTVSVYGE